MRAVTAACQRRARSVDSPKAELVVRRFERIALPNDHEAPVAPVGGPFVHSGIAGLVNAVFNNHNFTLVILDNGTTAMTGHQPHPGVDMAKLNLDGYGRISIEAVVSALGVKHVAVVKPFKVKKSIAAIKEALDYEGVSVVISQEICTLYARGLKRLKQRPFKISERCKNHRNCINDLACPAFYLEGDQVSIDADACVGCAVCAQICPENAITPVKMKKAG